MISRAVARTLFFLFVASPSLADEYVCTDFQYVSRETIGFVAEWQGLDWDGVDYRDAEFKTALNSDGGKFFLFAGGTTSDRLAECLVIAEQLTPKINEAFKDAVSRLGKNSSPENIEQIMKSWPEEWRDEYREAYFPVFSVGRTLVSDSWKTTVFATMLDEPERSLSAIDLILGQLSKCKMSQECRGAFAAFVGLN